MEKELKFTHQRLKLLWIGKDQRQERKSEVLWAPQTGQGIADALSRRSCIPKEFEHLKPKELHTIEMIEELVTGKVAPETEEERSRLIIVEHEKGHFGADQMFKQLWTRNIHWKGIREDIKKTVGKCEPCLRFVITQEGFHPYTPITEMWPMKRTTIVKVPTSKAGFRHIMVYMCLATRFVWLKALKNKTMEAVMTELLKIHRYFGKPLVINSDNGKEFVNQFTERLVALDEVDWRTISSYNSRGQGSIERQNRDIEIILMKSIDGEYGTWETKLDDTAYVMNTRISSRTNTMPFVLMLGRVPLGSQKYRMEKKIQGIVEEMPKEIEKREDGLTDWK
jgi:hypothetical protein